MGAEAVAEFEDRCEALIASLLADEAPLARSVRSEGAMVAAMRRPLSW